MYAAFLLTNKGKESIYVHVYTCTKFKSGKFICGSDITQVEWSDGTSCCVHRTYGDFFSFHTKVRTVYTL